MQSSQITVIKESESILVAGNPFRGYARTLTNAFQSLGIKSICLEMTLTYQDPIEFIKAAISKEYVRKRNEAISKSNAIAFEKAIVKNDPDYILVLNGVRVTPEAKAYCRKKDIKLALWAYDSIHHIPLILETAGEYDIIYTYEPEDLKQLTESGPTRFLPVAYDPNYYFPLRYDDNEFNDISFVGSFMDYPKRRNVLSSIIKSLDDKSLEIWTDTPRWYSPLDYREYLLFGAKKKVHMRMHTASHSEINGLYNRSKICLNIHHSQAQRAINPRTFEILGSGGFLMTDMRLDEIHGFECGRDYVLYSQIDDLIELIKGALFEDERRKRIAQSGHLVAERDHTYQSRASLILEDLRKVG